MASTLEQQLDQSLDAGRMLAAEHIHARAVLEDEVPRASVFAGDVWDLLRAAVAQANRHLARRAEGWTVWEVSGGFSDLPHEGISACNKLSFQAVARGRPVGDTLVVELTTLDTVVEYTVPSSAPGIDAPRESLGVREMPVNQFNPPYAADIVARYIAMLACRAEGKQQDRIRGSVGAVQADEAIDI